MPAAITIAEPALDMADAVVLLINDYAYAAPYVETEDEIFLKTVFSQPQAHSDLFEGLKP